MNKLIEQGKSLLNKQFPQSFLIKNPLPGTLVFFIIIFLFVVIYKPLHVRESRSFSFSFTMFLYCLINSVMVFVTAWILKRTNCFSKGEIWTIAKELLSILIILTVMGLSAYFAGFVMENPVSRWNWSTFFDSLARSALIGIFPVLLPSLLNIRYAFTPETFQEYKNADHIRNEKAEELIIIKSKAKKEELSFFPHEFIYAESEGNYVLFHLIKQERNSEVIIRNSISEIEQQLVKVPFIIRIHRAFIVNLEKVISKRGNSLGYQLKLKGSNSIVQVSRQNTQKFDKLIRQYHLSIHH